MKRTPSFLFAVISTLLLAVGAVRAAEKFDPKDPSDVVGEADAESRLPSLPCLGPRGQA